MRLALSAWAERPRARWASGPSQGAAVGAEHALVSGRRRQTSSAQVLREGTVVAIAYVALLVVILAIVRFVLGG